MKTGFFESFDKTQHFYRAWHPRENQKSILIMHRGHEHSGRLEHIASAPRFAEYSVFSYDQRGLGHTETPVSPHFMDYVRDLDSFVHFLNDEYRVSPKDLIIVANSIAGVIVGSWLHDFAPRIAGVAMLAPAFGIKLYVPFAAQAISLVSSFNPHFNVPSYVKSKVLTHSEEEQKAYDSDPLITRHINGALLVDMLNHGKRIVSDAAAINTPTLILTSENDYVVKSSLQYQYFLNLDTPHKEIKMIPGAYHGLLFETMREEIYQDIADFSHRCYALSPEQETGDPDQFTLNEYNAMVLKMMPLCEKINFSIQRSLLPSIGKLSHGMTLGLQYGFDSGISLDYVYRNTPSGPIDKGYLNAIGWRGIRIRKKNLLHLLDLEISRLQQAGKPIRILDIAGGPGNYLFDIKEKYSDAEIVINDFKTENVAIGEETIRAKGYTNMRFTCLDCFDPETYQKIDFTPNIIIISGIFELFGDNIQVSRAIRGAKEILAPNGSIIYTGQPWHPQLKMIAYVLNSHRGCDWVMRRRSQKELDKLFRLHGVNKERMEIDDFGIFTVSIARSSSH